jgi:RNA polymerase sigma factor (sigma-70 family)
MSGFASNGRSAVVGSLLTDEELVSLVLAGSADWYGVLIHRHQDALHRVAYSMVHDADVAADMAQDAFIRAFANLNRCREPARFRSWLMALLRNRCLDHLKERRRRDLPLDQAAEVADSAVDTLDELAERSTLKRGVDALPATLREAFLLRHVEELSYGEMAEILRTTVAAAKMRVSRARDILREQLAGAAPDERAAEERAAEERAAEERVSDVTGAAAHSSDM